MPLVTTVCAGPSGVFRPYPPKHPWPLSAPHQPLSSFLHHLPEWPTCVPSEASTFFQYSKSHSSNKFVPCSGVLARVLIPRLEKVPVRQCMLDGPTSHSKPPIQRAPAPAPAVLPRLGQHLRRQSQPLLLRVCLMLRAQWSPARSCWLHLSYWPSTDLKHGAWIENWRYSKADGLENNRCWR